MDFLSPGNIITLCVSVALIVVFRQMDRNNRSIEKAKKYGDKLKDELEAFIRDRTGKLDESSLALDLQQTKAVAAVNRLEKIREDLERKEAGLLERTKAVEGFGKQVEAYDATIKRLLEMTAAAETNLSRITSESDFADTLGKKLVASQKQLADIEAAIPDLLARFARDNEAALSGLQSDAIAKVSVEVADLERRVEAAHKSGSELAAAAVEKMKDVYQKALVEASRRADTLEDTAFQKLKEQASERLAKYKETIEEKTHALQELAKEKLAETQQLVKGFKGEWQSEASAFLEATRSEIARLETGVRDASALSAKGIAEIEDRMEEYRKDIESRLSGFDGLIGDVDRLDAELRLVMSDTEARVTGDFEAFAKAQDGKQDAFEAKLLERGEALQSRMAGLEGGLNELKSRAYDNVSEKLKVFEDEFFADLKKRSDAINASLERWKADVDERLATLTGESEGARKDVEAAYTLQLKERAQALAEQSRAQADKLAEQLAAVEADLRQRITASDESIRAFAEQYKREFEEARKAAAASAQAEFNAHALTVQELLRKEEREIETRTKELAAVVEDSRADAEAILSSVKSDFGAWQARNEHELQEARNLLAEKIASLEAAYKTGYADFVAGTQAEQKALRDSLDAIKAAVAAANAEFERKSAEALKEFAKAYEEMGSETVQSSKASRAALQDVRDSVEDTREKLFQKVQSDAANLSHTLEEIDRKQKAFIAQTKIFDRADELKRGLESDISEIKGEISRLEVYRDTMNALEQNYAKIRKLDDEASQKVSRFMAEKKRIDILESDFNKLLGLSDTIDRKISELTLTSDDVQQYQVQIRRFEESLAEANARYERLDKKAAVLDQTTTAVDKAFDGLKSIETSLADCKTRLADLPAEIAGVKGDVAALIEDKERVSLMVEKLSALDSIIEDVEKRTEKMQTAREWLARTETRLEEISRQSQDQLKLLGDLLKDEGASKKAKGAPPIGIRENVVKLAHQGWKVDEIARALHLSRGEVELILELPQK